MYHYRLATTYDIPWMERAALAAAFELPQEGQRAGLSPVAMAQRYQQRIRSTVTSPGGAAIVAHAGAEPTGYALVGAAADGSTGVLQGYVHDWWVAPRHRRRGVGRTLLALGEAWLAAQGAKKIKLVLTLDRQSGLLAADRSGFKPEGLLALKNLQ